MARKRTSDTVKRFWRLCCCWMFWYFCGE